MQYLTQLSASDQASYYRIGGDFESPVQRYLVTTPESRAICNQPELVGCEFTDRLRTAVTKALVQAPFRSLIESHPEHRVCVLNFLRGGLNFDIRSALAQAYGMNRHSSAFMSSQRSRREDGRWQVREDMYRKLKMPDDAIILVGDVVATGITVENGLDVLLGHLKSIGSSIRWLIFLTIGCHKLEKLLALFDAEFRRAFANYQGSCAVYFEGKFKLVDSRTELRIGIPGTDLIRRDAVLTPEFESSQFEQVTYPLERCTIYDAGSRAFDIASYLEDVQDYWSAVKALALEGWTLNQAVRERWPFEASLSPGAFLDAKRPLWRGVDEAFVHRQYEKYSARWPGLSEHDGNSSEALAALCDERLETLTLEQS